MVSTFLPTSPRKPVFFVGRVPFGFAIVLDLHILLQHGQASSYTFLMTPKFCSPFDNKHREIKLCLNFHMKEKLLDIWHSLLGS